jgi:sugar lactone lactonase YvrE
MDRRFALSFFAAVALAAITGTRVGMAAEETPPAGTITTVAGTGKAGFSGDGGPATEARLAFPFSVAVDAAGNLFIADADNNRVRKVSPKGLISTVAGIGQASFSGDGGPASKARLSFPTLMASDLEGNLFISEQNNQRVRKVSPDGLITTVAGTGKEGFSGDAGPATTALLKWPRGLAVDAAGNLFIVDHYNHRIRKVSPEGIITTVAGSGRDSPTKGVSAGDGGLATEARLNGPFGLALDRGGNLFFSELGDLFGTNRGYRVRKVDQNGIISTVAGSDAKGFSGDGGPATAARLNTPAGVAVDSTGNLFIGDLENQRVRKVDANGIISTVTLRGPIGLAVDAAGNLLVTDGDRILKLFGVAAPGLIAGQLFPSP